MIQTSQYVSGSLLGTKAIPMSDAAEWPEGI